MHVSSINISHITIIGLNNTLSVCNLHDVSWGTKGDNSASPLGSVKTEKQKDGREIAHVEIPDDPADKDDIWLEYAAKLAENSLWLRERKEMVVVNEQLEHDGETFSTSLFYLKQIVEIFSRSLEQGSF